MTPSANTAEAPIGTSILVLGMHRSGTSATTGVLQRLGVELGPDLVEAKPDNPKGFFEHREVMLANEAVLAAIGRSSIDLRPFPEDWQARPALAPHREKLKRLLLDQFGSKPVWALKDPRLCRLLPFWLDLLPELSTNQRVLIVARHPDEVAQSLLTRDKLPVEHTLMLWLDHVLQAERFTRSVRRAVVLYEDLMRDWRVEVERLATELDLPTLRPSESAAREIDQFLSRELRHHTSHRAEASGPVGDLSRRAFSALCDWRQEGREAGERIDAIARDFDSLLAAFSAVWSPLADKLSHAETSLHASNATVDRLHGELASERERGHLEREQARLDRERASLERAEFESHRKNAELIREELRSKLSSESRARAKAENELAQVRSQLEAAKGELDWAYHTRSWKVTAPLRTLTAVGRKLRNR